MFSNKIAYPYPSSSSTTMIVLKVLGYADSNPCEFALDLASPHCQVSASFLYWNSLVPKLDASGRQHAKLKISVPTQGGYFTTLLLVLVSVAAGGSDIVLGADWLSSCHITTATNMVLSPSPEIVQTLQNGSTWTADGKSFTTSQILPLTSLQISFYHFHFCTSGMISIVSRRVPLHQRPGYRHGICLRQAPVLVCKVVLMQWQVSTNRLSTIPTVSVWVVYPHLILTRITL